MPLRKLRLDKIVPAFVLMAAFGTCLLILTVHRNIQEQRQVAAATLAVANFAGRLESHLAERLNAGRLLGQRFLRDPALDEAMFRTQTAFLHELFQDFQALNWVDATGVIRIVTPERGNAPALDLNLRDLPLPGAALALAEQTGEMQVTPPLILAQGGLGFAAYVPVSAGQRRTGFVNIVFTAEPLVRSALGPELDAAYDIAVLVDDVPLFVSGGAGVDWPNNHETTITVAGHEWVLRARPKPGTGPMDDVWLDGFILVAGSIVAVLLAVLSHVALRRKQELHEQEARQQDFVDASTDWYWEMDADLRLIWCSEGVERFFDVSADSMVGMTRDDFREPSGDDEAWMAHKAAIAARRPFRNFIYATTVGETRRWVRVSGVPVHDNTGAFTGYRGAASDVTELVRSRSQAEQANHRLAQAVEELSELFSLWDEDDRLIFGNRVFRDLNSNIPEVTVPGTRFEDYLRAGVETGHMKDIEGRQEEFIARAIARRYADHPEPFEVERADGTVLLLHEQRLAEGGFITIGLDITRQRQSDAALHASEERLALASQQLCIWDWNLETDTLFMSPGFAERLGYSAEEFEAIQRESISTILHPDDVDGYKARLRRHLEEPQSTFTSEHRFRTRDGSYRWFLAIGQAEVNAAGSPVRSTGVLTDIHERVQLENALRQAHKMEAIGNLTGGVAHDFNNLLTVVLGNLELIREFNRDPNVRELVDAGIAATQRGADLVRNMLGFARKSRLQPEVTDLNQILDKTTSWVARTLPETITLDLPRAADLWHVRIDPSLTQNVVLNLILNARDAMPDGGRLTLSAANVEMRPGIAGADELDIAPGRYVCLSVTDTGQGIPAAELSKIFEPFFTTKAPGSGSGLGLSLVHGFMKQSGGAVRVLSVPGQGATFELYFPVVDADLPQRSLTEQPMADQPNPTGRIFLVEDETEVLRVLTRILTGAGYSVTSAESGDDALALWQRDKAFDLLVTDIVMPGKVQGTELARRLKETHPDLPVIFLSGYAKEADHGPGDASSADLRLMKPVGKATLLQAVDRALQQAVAMVAE